MAMKTATVTSPTTSLTYGNARTVGNTMNGAETRMARPYKARMAGERAGRAAWFMSSPVNGGILTPLPKPPLGRGKRSAMEKAPQIADLRGFSFGGWYRD